MGSMDEWEELVDDLIPSISSKFYKPHLDRIGDLGAPSEKLDYFFLVQSDQQSFNTIQRVLSVSNRTVDLILKILLRMGFMVINHRYLYWVSLIHDH